MAYTAKKQLLALVEEGFQKAAWHGPNLRSALRGVRAEEAAWRPARGRHNIWEIAVHVAYWKYAVTRRLTGSKTHEFPEKGANFFARSLENSTKAEAQKNWARDLAMLTKMHKELRSAAKTIQDSVLLLPARGSRQTPSQMIGGIAMHDAYHAGQIRLLRQLYKGRKH